MIATGFINLSVANCEDSVLRRYAASFFGGTTGLFGGTGGGTPRETGGFLTGNIPGVGEEEEAAAAAAVTFALYVGNFPGVCVEGATTFAAAPEFTGAGTTGRLCTAWGIKIHEIPF